MAVAGAIDTDRSIQRVQRRVHPLNDAHERNRSQTGQRPPNRRVRIASQRVVDVQTNIGSCQPLQMDIVDAVSRKRLGG